MNYVEILSIVPCFGTTSNGNPWKNSAVVYVEKSKKGVFCRVDKGVEELASKKLPDKPCILLYDRFGRIVGWQSNE